MCVHYVLGDNIEPVDPNAKKNGSRFEETLNMLVIFADKIHILARESVRSSVRSFLVATMFSNRLITRRQFDEEINDILNRFQHTTVVAFGRSLDLMRLLIHVNAIMAFPIFNWKILSDEQRHGQDCAFFNQPAISTDEQSNQSCSCATSRTCNVPAFLLSTNGTVKYKYPGFVYGCQLPESVFLSSWSCLYSSACIDELRLNLNLAPGYLEWYHEGTGKPVVLNATETRFNVNDTIETLAYSMFIESWTRNVSYERYFNSCASTSCTYTYHYRFDRMEMFTTFLSVFSGLSLAIRFAVPHLIRIVGEIRARFRIAPAQ
jgi:hypothetical protein